MYKNNLQQTSEPNGHNRKKKYCLVEAQDDYAVFMEADADPRDFNKRIVIER